MNRYLPAGLLLASSAALAQTHSIQPIYSEIQAYPSSQVAGVPGLFIDSIDRVGVSPSGNHWILSLNVDTGSATDDEFLIVDGAVVAQEGTAPSFVPAGRLLQVIDQRLWIMNDGSFAFAGDLDGDSATDDIIVSGDSMGGFTLHAMEQTQLVGGPVGWLADSVNSAVLTTQGVAYEVDSIDGGPAAGMDNIIMFNDNIFLHAQVDAPSGQIGGATETWENFDNDDLFFSADGSRYMLQGDLTGDTGSDDVLVVDGVVVLQEGAPIAGSGLADVIDNSGIAAANMSGCGNWMAKGDFDVTNDGWAVLNGNLVAKEGDIIHPGVLEVWDSTFSAVSCNDRGDFILVGSTDADLATDFVVVFNNEMVIAREGDPIDMDGNGQFDDNTFISSFGIDDFVLTNDRRVYFSALLKDGGNVGQGDFFGYIQIDDAQAGITFCDPAEDNSTNAPTAMRGYLSGGGSSGLHLEAFNGPPAQFGYFLIGNGASDPGTPISQGRLCLSSAGGSQIGRYNVAGGELNSVGVFNSHGVLENVVSTSTSGFGFDVPTNVPSIGGAIMAGDTWHFQLWHRENMGASNFSNAVTVQF